MSPLAEIKQAEAMIKAILRRQDIQLLSRDEQKLISQLKQDITDARLDVRDAEYAETGEEYRRNVAEAKARLEKIIAAVLSLSQQNIFSSIEVAELTAKLEIIGTTL